MDPQNPPNASGGPQRQQPVYDTNHGGHYGELDSIKGPLCLRTIIYANSYASIQVPVPRYVS